MGLYETHAGHALIEELCRRDRMTREEAVSWIEKKTGYEFDAGGLYKLQWRDGDPAERLSDSESLRIHIMNDAELNAAEREYFRYNKLSPRKPWEPHTYQQFLGRAEAARRINQNHEQGGA